MPNTLLLISDEHNPRYASVYGHPFVQTPNMAWLADQGTVFENAYCPSPLCMPCRSAFMTGQRVHRLQTYNNCSMNVEQDVPTYGRVLAEQGIHTVHIGRTHVFAPGSQLGFSEIIGSGAHGFPGDTDIGRNPLQIRQGAALRADRFGVDSSCFDNDTDRVNAAIRWLADTSTTLHSPWTLTVNLNYPHFPHYVTQEMWDAYPQGEDLPEHGMEAESAAHPRADDIRAHFELNGFTEAQVRGQRRGYLGCVTFIDQQLGRLIQALKTCGQFENTNIIYTSDHGEMLGKYGMWWKCSLYEDAARIPCIAAGPDYSSGVRIMTPVDLHDAQASLFESAKRDRPADWIGMPLQKTPINDQERVTFSEYHGHGVRASAFMVRKGVWKYIHHIEAPHQLFNIEDDPDELHNLYTLHPDKSVEMEGELRRICDPELENERAADFIQNQIEALQELKK